MQSKGNAPTAAQKRWRECVRAFCSIVSDEPAVIHHCVGATGKHNKLAIGHWWILPLTQAEHLALHAGDTFGHGSRKEFEKHEFEYMCARLSDLLWAKDMPPPEVMEAIQDYHR